MRRTRHQPGEYNNITLLQKLIFEFQAQTGVGQWLVILKSEYLDFDLRSTNSIKNLTFCNHPNLDPELRPSSCGWVLTHACSCAHTHVFVHICAFAHMLCFMRSDTYMLESMHICMLVHLKCAVSGAFMHLYFYVLCAVCNCPVPQNQGEMKPKYCILNYHLHIAYIA